MAHAFLMRLATSLPMSRVRGCRRDYALSDQRIYLWRVQQRLDHLYPLTGPREGTALAESGFQHNAKKRVDVLSVAAGVFAVSVFLLAFFALRGDLGKYYDDYVFAGRDPVMQSVNWAGNPWGHAPYFWRPLLFIFLYYAQGALWDHQWMFHLLNASSHGLVALGLYALIRRLAAMPQAAAVGALLFLVFPLHFDVVFWSTAITSSIPAWLTMGLCLLFVAYARGAAGMQGARGWWVKGGLIVLAFFVPCWYEQPITLVPMLPCLYFAVCPAEEAWKTRLKRSLTVTVLMGLTLVLYLGLMFATVPAGRRGGAASVVHASELGGRVRFVSDQIWDLATRQFQEYALGGLHLGWVTLGNFWGVVSVALIFGMGGVWIVWFCVRNPDATDAEGNEAAQRVGAQNGIWASVFGVGWSLLAWLPFVPIRDQWVTPRCFYVPMLGVCICVAMCIDSLLVRTWRTRGAVWVRGWVGMTTLVGVCAGAVCMVGWQTAYRNRTKADERQTALLAAATSRVPRGTVFVPLEDNFRYAHTPQTLFNVGLLSWTGSPSTAVMALRHAAARDDIFCTKRDFWNPLPLTDMDGQGFGYEVAFPGYATPEGRARVPWSKALPFVIAADGSIQVIDHMVLERADGNDVEFELPITAKVSGLSYRSYVVANTRAPTDVTGGWVDGAERPVASAHLWSWGVGRDAVRMYANGGAGLPGVVRSHLPANDEARDLVFRVSFDEQELTRGCVACGTTALVWTLLDKQGSQTEIARITLDPTQSVKDARWYPVRVTVPPTSEGAVLEVRASGSKDFAGPFASVVMR